MHPAPDTATAVPPRPGCYDAYLETLGLLERLHRLLLDVIKDEFERIGLIELNPVQALLLFNIGDNELTAGEIRSRGYYQGSNVSYNLKKLVEGGYVHHKRCEIDRRAVRIRLTERGQEVRRIVGGLFRHHAALFDETALFRDPSLSDIGTGLRRLERFWSDHIRYIY